MKVLNMVIFYDKHAEVMCKSVKLILHTSLCDSSSCESKIRPPRCKNLKRLYKKYTAMFVEMHPSRTLFQPPRLRLHSKTKRDTSHKQQSVVQGACPWVWVVDHNASRFPTTIVRAECTKCSMLCEVVYYTHPVLLRRCDNVSGHVVWHRSAFRAPIAYQYNPS